MHPPPFRLRARNRKSDKPHYVNLVASSSQGYLCRGVLERRSGRRSLTVSHRLAYTLSCRIVRPLLIDPRTYFSDGVSHDKKIQNRSAGE